jgi:hypothetical protein
MVRRVSMLFVSEEQIQISQGEPEEIRQSVSQ